MKVLFSLAVLMFANLAYSKGQIYIAIPANLPPPLLFERGLELNGIAPEYSREIGTLLEKKFELSLVPRNRLSKYLRSGVVDISCYASIDWTRERDHLNWSNTLFKKREVILGPKPAPKKIDGFFGKTLGTMLGYVYPKLDDHFKSKEIIREDGPNEEANINKLRNGHIQYIVIDELYLDYLKKDNASLEANRGRFLLQDYVVSCAVSRKSKVTVDELNSAIEKLKSSGKLEAIFKKYGGSL